MARTADRRGPRARTLPAALLVVAGGAALAVLAGALLAQDPPAPDAPGAGMADAPAAAAEESPVTILYTIHNTGYIEPCG
jgi:hypothetical protein